MRRAATMRPRHEGRLECAAQPCPPRETSAAARRAANAVVTVAYWAVAPHLWPSHLDQVRSRLETTTLARRFCPPEFTISQLREVRRWGQLGGSD